MIIGVSEYVDIPAWHIARLRAKVDTGARTSALHVENIRELERGRVSFDVRLHKRHVQRRVTIETRITRRGRVRPTTGELRLRIFVTVKVRIGTIEQEIELGLVDREKMLFRMLIGRRALAHHFLIDPARRYVLGGGPKLWPAKAAKAPRAAKKVLGGS